MSLREEDRENKNCPSRGLGIAAAAMGVGVGAALYCFFSKRPENPNDEGSTSTWESEQAQAFSQGNKEQEDSADDSYSTFSEHSTTDTSMHESPYQRNCCCNDTSSQCDSNTDGSNGSDTDSIITIESSDSSDFVELDSDAEDMGMSDEDLSETGYVTCPVATTSAASDLDDDWDVTNSSTDVPQDGRAGRSPLFSFLGSVGEFVSPRRGKRRMTEQEQLNMLRAQAFRERSWSLEECSICFDVILKSQEVMSLPCTHHFHTACILPWLQEQQTCPNCRKAAE